LQSFIREETSGTGVDELENARVVTTFVEGRRGDLSEAGDSLIEILAGPSLVSGIPAQNPIIHTDVNNDSNTTPLDALRAINFIRRQQFAGDAIEYPADSTTFLDVSGDQKVTSLDALLVINQIAREQFGLSIESESTTQEPADTGLVPQSNVVEDRRVSLAPVSAASAPIPIADRENDDRQREFVAKCRNLGIRTVAGFMIGFPEDRRTDIMWVLRYAKQVNPTFANFNVVTPYPGTEFYEQVKHQIADHDYSNYSVYHPVMKYRHLTQQQVADLHAACFSKFYFRSRYLKENGGLLWPRLGKWIPGVYAPSTTPSTIDDENFSESANGSDPPSARSGHRAA